MNPSLFSVSICALLLIVYVEPGSCWGKTGKTEYGEWKPLPQVEGGGGTGNGAPIRPDAPNGQGGETANRMAPDSVNEQDPNGNRMAPDPVNEQDPNAADTGMDNVSPNKVEPGTGPGVSGATNVPGTPLVVTGDPNAKEIKAVDVPPKAAKENIERKACLDLDVNEGAKCYASGDPHTYTFDGARHNYQGTCRYTAITGTPEYEGIPFRVSVKTSHLGAVTRVSFLHMVEIKIGSKVITLKRDGELMLNGKKISAPFVSPVLEGEAANSADRPCEFTVLPNGAKGFKVSTNFSLVVTYDGYYSFQASLQDEKAFKGKVHGTCGSYDGDHTNDYKKPDGTVVENENDFGNSWIEEKEENETDCVRPDGEEVPCTEENEKKAETACAILKNQTGPFAECLEQLSDKLKHYYEDCVFDGCAMGDPETFACDAIEPAVTACQAILGKGINWRTPDFCPKECEEGMEYQTCASPVMPTCLVPEPTANEKACAQGCFCKKGFVLANEKCVSADECGCYTADGAYHAKDSSWVSDDCGTSCACLSKGESECVAYTCPSDTTCKLGDNGVTECACKAGFQLNGDNCEATPDTTAAADVSEASPKGLEAQDSPPMEAPNGTSRASPTGETPQSDAPAALLTSTGETEEACTEHESYTGGKCSCKDPFVRYPDGSCNEMLCQCDEY